MNSRAGNRHTTARPTPRRWWRTHRPALLLPTAALALAAVALPRVTATFTATTVNSGSTLGAATVALSATPATALLTYGAMGPGDQVTNTLVVTNQATSPDLRYAISATATNTDAKGLKDQLVLTIRTIDVTVPATPCDAFDGAQLYTGDVDATAGLLVGDIADDTDINNRALASGASETLCFRAQMPDDTGNAYAGATTTVTFTFNAKTT